MIIRIKGDDVIFEDEKSTTLFLTTNQLLELAHIVQSISREDGGIIFNVIEFEV